jgi:hypothetical protein
LKIPLNVSLDSDSKIFFILFRSFLNFFKCLFDFLVLFFWFYFGSFFFWKMPLLLTALPMIFFTGGYITVTLNNEPKYPFRWRTRNCLCDSIKVLSNIVQKPLKVREPQIKIHHSLKFSAILNFQENWTEIWAFYKMVKKSVTLLFRHFVFSVKEYKKKYLKNCHFFNFNISKTLLFYLHYRQYPSWIEHPSDSLSVSNKLTEGSSMSFRQKKLFFSRKNLQITSNWL